MPTHPSPSCVTLGLTSLGFFLVNLPYREGLKTTSQAKAGKAGITAPDPTHVSPASAQSAQHRGRAQLLIVLVLDPDVPRRLAADETETTYRGTPLGLGYRVVGGWAVAFPSSRLRHWSLWTPSLALDAMWVRWGLWVHLPLCLLGLLSCQLRAS